MDYKKIIKYGFWLVAILLVINAFLNGGQDEIELTLDIDFDKVIEHEVVEVEETVEDNMVKYQYTVLLLEESSEKEIKETVKLLAQEADYEKDYSALVIDLFANEEFIGRTSYTLGRAIHAPEGDLSLAAEVEPGQHHQFEFAWDILNKDWEQQPEEKELEIWAYWHDLKEIENKSELEASERTREEYDLTQQELEDILQEQQLWQLMDIQ